MKYQTDVNSAVPTVSIPKFLVGLAVILLSLSIIACQAAERRKPVLSMSVSEIFPDRTVQALASAAARGDVSRVTQLVNQGVNVDSGGYLGITPLFWAMQRLNRAGYKRLLELGADPNHRWTNGSSVMFYAPQIADPYYLQQALLHGGDPIGSGLPIGGKPLMRAVSSDETHPEIVRMLIEAGADVNMADDLGFTPLMRAAISNKYDLIYVLLEAGADPNRETINSKSTFMDLLKRREPLLSSMPEMRVWREKVIELLRERGYDVE